MKRIDWSMLGSLLLFISGVLGIIYFLPRPGTQTTSAPNSPPVAWSDGEFHYFSTKEKVYLGTKLPQEKGWIWAAPKMEEADEGCRGMLQFIKGDPPNIVVTLTLHSTAVPEVAKKWTLEEKLASLQAGDEERWQLEPQEDKEGVLKKPGLVSVLSYSNKTPILIDGQETFAVTVSRQAGKRQADNSVKNFRHSETFTLVEVDGRAFVAICRVEQELKDNGPIPSIADATIIGKGGLITYRPIPVHQDAQTMREAFRIATKRP